jgi:peptidyl-tRNA hydrolase
MTPGKIASQAGHAYLDSLLSASQLDPQIVSSYRQDSHGIKVCLKAKNLYALERACEEVKALGVPCALITDLGYTQFEGRPTITALGIGPVRRSVIDVVTKRFQLLN